MARDLWVTVDDGEVERVRTDLPGRCSRGAGEEFGARRLSPFGRGSKLDQGKDTPRMRLRIDRVEVRATNWYVHHCTRLDTPGPEHQQEDLFRE